MRWLSFEAEGRQSFGYLTGDGQGVVDVGRRTDLVDLKKRDRRRSGCRRRIPG